MRSRWRDPRMMVTCNRAAGGSRERFRIGQALGRLRAAQFDRRRRALQLLKTPALPGVYLARIARTVFRARRHRLAFVLVLPVIAWYLVCWSAGQFRGLVSRVGIDVENRDAAAFFREPKGDGAADALTAAGNDRYLA